nr:hypothetical protein [Pantoea sp. 201603H]
MKEWNIDMPLSDEVLVAWLDGELSPEVAQQVEKRVQVDPEAAEQLALLDRASLDFAAAFAPMLDDAPVEMLREKLRATPSHLSPGVSRRSLLAATVAALAVGGGLDVSPIASCREMTMTTGEIRWRNICRSTPATRSVKVMCRHQNCKSN